MTDMRNKLPVGIHLDSGGCARKRMAYMTIDMGGCETGSFSTGEATGIRIQGWYRGTGDLSVLFSYAGSANLQRVEFALLDGDFFTDSLPAGTTVYWACYNGSIPTPQEAQTNDLLLVTLYG